MKDTEYRFLPTETKNELATEEVVEHYEGKKILGDAPCPCCGNITIPNHGDAVAYICPVRFWEIDLFAKADDEPSDQNYGLTLCEARNNYGEFGAALPRLKEHCTEAKDWELPRK